MIRERLEHDGTGHDWWHIERVRRVALHLAKEEKADPVVVELAALLHDIADHKFHGGDETVGPRMAKEWLEAQFVPPAMVEHVVQIVASVSFKGSDVPDSMSSIEGKVVQDADRLDAMGAIGVARAFAYGGHKNRLLYDPDQTPERHDNFETYKNSAGPTVNHFYEKLLLLKDRMHTVTGRQLAENRHDFMVTYLEQFYAEWRGDK